MPSAAKGKKSTPGGKKTRPAPKAKPSKTTHKPKPAPAKKPTAKHPAPAAKSGGAAPSAKPVPVGAAALKNPEARRHVLSLSFLRDGDEFMARLETNAGQITELKNRSLDQLLTLVANELEDLLE
jgi:hypothetical protein